MSEEKKTYEIITKDSPWGWVFIGIAVASMATCTAVREVSEHDYKKAMLVTCEGQSND